ncbi:MAG TPA: hypothetical protein DCL00_02135, partial [Opitutae bacterium]|nr:hypothetical protein [Opitutae bacterium]
MRFILLAFTVFFSSVWAEENVISQARFFRLLKIKPTDEDAAPFGGLNTVVITHQALLGKKKKLEFADVGIKDLRAFSYLSDLEWLRLSHNPVFDLSPLAKLKNLQVLSLYGIPKSKNVSSRISDLKPLAGLNNLWSLALDEHSISDLSPISSLSNLRTLYITNNEVSDVSDLSVLTGLKTLFLSYNDISDISPISALNQLEWLRLSSNKISDLWPISGLSMLEQCYLENNQVSNLAPLANLKQLRELKLGG